MSADVFYYEGTPEMNYTIPRKRELRREMGVIYMALDAVTKFMAKWLDDNLKTLSSDYWDRYVVSSLYESQRKTLAENGAKSLFDLDQPTILSVFLQNKQLLTSKFGVDQQLFGDAHRIKDIRNKYFHKNSKPLAASRYKHDLGTMKLFLEGLGAPADVVADICDSCDNEGETPSVSSRVNDTVIKIPVPRVDSAIAVGVNSDAKGTQRQKDIVRAVKVVRNSPLAVGAMPQTLFSESSLLSMWHRPDELYASIKNCLKLDFDEYKFGKCLLYRPEDRVPSELSLGTGWQWAIVLQIFEADKVRIAKEIAKFNRFDVECSVTGDYAVWKYASPQGNHERAAEISQIVFLPNWYVDAIASTRGAKYQRDRLGVRQTLQASDDVRRLYLGTYAPRSFAEMVAIADYTFSMHPECVKNLGAEISICDLGSGSGPATMGLIWSLKKLRLSSIRRIVVYAIDGNDSALKLFEELLHRLRGAWESVEIVLKAERILLDDQTFVPCCSQVDFVISSKFVQELHSENDIGQMEQMANAILKTGGISYWMANPGINLGADKQMAASTCGNEVIVSKIGLNIRVCGIRGCDESVEEAISFKVERKLTSKLGG